MMRFSSGRVRVRALAVVLSCVAGGVAHATIPDPDGMIHGCYNPNEAVTKNGTPLSIVDGDSATCSRNQAAVTWNQTGSPGQDGVSVTSESLDPGESTSCPEGGTQFTAADGNVTYACNGAKGDTGAPGPAGSGAAYTNYGDGWHNLGPGLTQTVASVTVPAGSYVLMGTVSAITDSFVQCSFAALAQVSGQVALLQGGKVPIIGDVTFTGPSNVVFLRCNTLSGSGQALGEFIATRVGSVTPSL